MPSYNVARGAEENYETSKFEVIVVGIFGREFVVYSKTIKCEILERELLL